MMPNNPNLIAFEVEGTTFHVEILDDCCEPPWEHSGWHGPVSEWTSRSKCPGEWILDEDGIVKRYDFAEAMRIAKRDGWDAPPYGVGTKGERALRAVTADFEHLRRWCKGDWKYVCLHVMLLGEDDEYGESGVLYDDYLGNVEYDYSSDGYWMGEAKAMASEILQEVRRDKAVAKINRRFKDAMECGV